jgi:hypothetical protein
LSFLYENDVPSPLQNLCAEFYSLAVHISPEVQSAVELSYRWQRGVVRVTERERKEKGAQRCVPFFYPQAAAGGVQFVRSMTRWCRQHSFVLRVSIWLSKNVKEYQELPSGLIDVLQLPDSDRR